MMRKIFLTGVLFFSFFPVFSDYTIDVSSTKNEVNIGENFNIVISVENNAGGIVVQDFKIPGVENFLQLGTSQSDQVISDNGQITAKKEYVIILQAQQEGEFTVGPVEVSVGKDKEVLQGSNVIHIQVHGGNSITSNSLNSDEKHLSQDTGELHDIKSPENAFFLQKNFFFGIGIVIFLLGFYAFLQKYLPKTDISPRKKEIIEKKVGIFDDIIDDLKHLKKQISQLSKSQFYSEFNILMRKFLLRKGIENAESITLKELQNKYKTRDSAIMELFEKSYYKEFENVTDDVGLRGEFIDIFLEILKK